MAIRFETLREVLNHGFDTVIDVRSPAEFAEDHLPDALNLPALDNDERAEVGWIYTRQSPFLARKIGAAKVARNVAAHLDGPLRDRNGSWQPLVCCWRGGQRSASVATILRAVGWRTETLAGGYRGFRRLVHAALYEAPFPCPVVLLDGYTGTAKTDLLARLPAQGVQVIDLEGLARHRGSLLGAYPGGQPPQKMFESRLACALQALDPARPVLIEAESSRIGALNLPPRLWQAMCAAPAIELQAAPAARARYLARGYADIAADPDRLRARLQPLRRIRGHATVDGWEALLAQGAHRALAAALIAQHYDPAYARSRAVHPRAVLGRVAMADLQPPARDRAAATVAAMLAARSDAPPG